MTNTKRKGIVTVDSATKPVDKALKALTKAFREDLEDPELSDRLENFKRAEERYKELHNSEIHVINEKISVVNALRQSILDQAMEGILATEAIARVKETEKEIEDLRKSIAEYREKVDYNKNLIDFYIKNSNTRHFVWWKAFKAVDPKNTPVWTEWKKIYENKII